MRVAGCFILAAAVVSLGACRGDPSSPLMPTEASLAAGGNREEIRVNMLDNCDPETFNAVIGPGACVRGGGLTFQRFIDRLTRDQSVPSWRFSPGEFGAFVGQTIEAYNGGGEEHTFTEVASFGGGFVTMLNTLSGNPVPAPECLNFQALVFVAPGQTFEADVDHAGIERYQCCIHPWMRAVVHVH
jgi:plastocyanin